MWDLWFRKVFMEFVLVLLYFLLFLPVFIPTPLFYLLKGVFLSWLVTLVCCISETKGENTLYPCWYLATVSFLGGWSPWVLPEPPVWCRVRLTLKESHNLVAWRFQRGQPHAGRTGAWSPLPLCSPLPCPLPVAPSLPFLGTCNGSTSRLSHQSPVGYLQTFCLSVCSQVFLVGLRHFFKALKKFF